MRKIVIFLLLLAAFLILAGCETPTEPERIDQIHRMFPGADVYQRAGYENTYVVVEPDGRMFSVAWNGFGDMIMNVYFKKSDPAVSRRVETGGN